MKAAIEWGKRFTFCAALNFFALTSVLAQGDFIVPDLGITAQLPLHSSDGGKDALLVSMSFKRQVPEKISPKHNWSFPYLTTCYVKTPKKPDQHDLRFRVFSQSPPSSDSLQMKVARVLLRLWDFNYYRLNLEHSDFFDFRKVDVYLCTGGKAGGEQLFGEDPYELDSFNKPQRVNMIYFYEVAGLTQPLEIVREIAHEYGHASLPAVGTFKGPESWANGHLGERLYLKWLHDDLREGRLKPSDACGATSEMVEGYLKKNVEPLVKRIASNGVDQKLLGKGDQEAFEAYLGLALYAEALLPRDVFRRAIELCDSQKPGSFAQALLAAVSEKKQCLMSLPKYLVGQKIWIPVGKGKLIGSKPLLDKGGWKQILVTQEQIGVLKG